MQLESLELCSKFSSSKEQEIVLEWDNGVFIKTTLNNLSAESVSRVLMELACYIEDGIKTGVFK